MSSQEGEQTAGEVEETEPEAGETPAEAENETDKVKPVIYIGLTLTFLLCLGKLKVFLKTRFNIVVLVFRVI